MEEAALAILLALGIVLMRVPKELFGRFITVLSLPVGELSAQFGKALNLACHYPCTVERTQFALSTLGLGLALFFAGFFLFCFVVWRVSQSLFRLRQ